MNRMNRRELLSAAGMAAAAALDRLLAPVKAVAADAKPIRIKNVETFNIEIPATPAEIEAGTRSVLAEDAIKAAITDWKNHKGGAEAPEMPKAQEK